jgi:pantoate--beta-alanine ligase
MKRLETHQEVAAWRRSISAPVSFVPTMGALHQGHMSLVERAKENGAAVIVSIFVNPTQFNDPKDLQRYPRPLEQDLEMLEKAGVSAVFLPRAQEIYSDGYRFEVREKALSHVLCGPRRPGHFEGVLTVVMKLFLMVRPDRAYFGEKDYQQLRLIQDMAKAFFLGVEVVPVETMREPDGLAMSSRNLLLTPEHRERAPVLYRVLKTAPTAEAAAQELEQAGFRVDYVEEHWGRRFAAAFLGEVRLIDNVAL